MGLCIRHTGLVRIPAASDVVGTIKGLGAVKTLDERNPQYISSDGAFAFVRYSD